MPKKIVVVITNLVIQSQVVCQFGEVIFILTGQLHKLRLKSEQCTCFCYNQIFNV
jgi:hypothetical protein